MATPPDPPPLHSPDTPPRQSVPSAIEAEGPPTQVADTRETSDAGGTSTDDANGADVEDEGVALSALPWRERWARIIFEHDTPAGKQFDAWLLAAILVSVLIVILESVDSIREQYAGPLRAAEIFFTLLFTVEYVVRLVVAPYPGRYARSFYGIVDLLSVLPTYLMLFLPVASPAQRLATVRALRLLRAFRIFKLRTMLTEADALQQALWQSRAKIAVFLSAVLIAVVIAGSALHLIEGDRNPDLASIPQGMYFTIVTMSTVGYGDVSPVTNAGKAVTTVIILLGYSLIVVPTGIVSAEIAKGPGEAVKPRTCPRCDLLGHGTDARYCRRCGERLPPRATTA